jgi:hypothetical protein
MIPHGAPIRLSAVPRRFRSENEEQKIDEIKENGRRKTWREGRFLRMLPSSGHGHRG